MIINKRKYPKIFYTCKKYFIGDVYNPSCSIMAIHILTGAPENIEMNNALSNFRCLLYVGLRLLQHMIKFDCRCTPFQKRVAADASAEEDCWAVFSDQVALLGKPHKRSMLLAS